MNASFHTECKTTVQGRNQLIFLEDQDNVTGYCT